MAILVALLVLVAFVCAGGIVRPIEPFRTRWRAAAACLVATAGLAAILVDLGKSNVSVAAGADPADAPRVADASGSTAVVVPVLSDAVGGRLEDDRLAATALSDYLRLNRPLTASALGPVDDPGVACASSVTRRCTSESPKSSIARRIVSEGSVLSGNGATAVLEDRETRSVSASASSAVDVAVGPKCGPGEVASGATVSVTATALNVRVGPGSAFSRVVNDKASEESGRTVFVQLDRPARVFETCRSDDWSQIQVAEPFAYTGWVANRYLEAQ